jgi:hypothetical protein
MYMKITPAFLWRSSTFAGSCLVDTTNSGRMGIPAVHNFVATELFCYHINLWCFSRQ